MAQPGRQPSDELDGRVRQSCAALVQRGRLLAGFDGGLAWPGLADDAAGDVTARASAGQHTSLTVVCTAYQRTRQELDCCTCWASWRWGGGGQQAGGPAIT